MRNSAYYARKVRRLFRGAGQAVPSEVPPDRIELLLQAVLAENALPRQIQAGMETLRQEFVDFNELRVSPPKDISEVLGRNFPGVRAKAEAITRALNVAFDRTNALSLEYLQDMPKRTIRKLLREDLGLSLYAESVVTLYGFGGHAVPVDEHLLVALKLEGRIHPDSDLTDLQGFLERIIPAKDAMTCQEALRNYVSRSARRVAAEMARLEKARRAAAEKAQAKAEAKAEAKAQAHAAAAAAAQAPSGGEAEAGARAKPSKPARQAAPKPAAGTGGKAPARPGRAGKAVTKKRSRTPSPPAKAKK